MVMNKIQAPIQPGLRQIYPCPSPGTQEIKQEDFDDFLLIVPSLSCGSESYQSGWPCFRNDSWIHAIASQLSTNAAILFFEHRLRYADFNDWQKLLHSGELLAQNLALLTRSPTNGRRKRFIVLAHGFGGFIVKKALNDLASSSAGPDQYKTLSMSLKALILISCPHLTNDNRTSWKTVRSMLLAGTNKIPQELEQPEKLEILREVCTTYEQCAVDVNTATIRLYESRPTELRGKSRLGQAKEAVLVDYDLAGCGYDDWPSIEVPSNHRDILNLQTHVAEQQQLMDFTSKFKASPTKHTSTSSRGSFDNVPYQIPHFNHQQQLPIYLNKPEIELKDFCGRGDLLQTLESKLCHDRLDPPSADGLLGVVLHGLGGIGKSSAASKFVDVARENKWFDLIIWVPSTYRTTVVQALAAAARSLHLVQEGELVDFENDWKKTLNWLQNPVSHARKVPSSPSSSMRWLMVFDDVNDAHMVKAFIPPGQTGSVLMTTRDPSIASEVELLDPDLFLDCTPSGNSLRVKKFDLDESLSFLTKLTGSNDENSLKAVAEELDGIPVALRCMGEMMKRMTPLEFVKAYKDPVNHRSLFRSKLKHHKMYHATNVADAWGLEHLDLGVELLNVIALLNPASIRESILKQAQDWDYAEIDNGYPARMLDYTLARDELKRLSLVSHDKEKETIAVARVIQATVKSNMTRPILVEAFNFACTLLLESWPRTGAAKGKVWKNNPRHTWDECDSVRCHVDGLIQHYEYLKKIGLEDDVNTESFCWLLIYSGWFDHDRGKSESADQLFERAHDLCDKIGSADDSEVRAEIHACRGAIAAEQNDAKNCIDHYEKFFDLTKLRYDDDTASDQGARVNMAKAWNEFGVAKMMRDHIDGESGAYNAFEKSRRYLMDDLGAEDQRILRTWGLATINLSVVSWERNQLRQAIRILDDLVSKLDESTFGTKDALVYGRIFHAYGNAYESKGNHKEAKKYHEEAFNRHKDTLGIDHHRTADVAMRMAKHAQRDGEFDKSHEYLDKARKVFDSKAYYRPERARCLKFESELLKEELKIDEGAKLQEDAEKLFNEVLKERQGYEQDSPIPASSFDRLVTFWSR